MNLYNDLAVYSPNLSSFQDTLSSLPDSSNWTRWRLDIRWFQLFQIWFSERPIEIKVSVFALKTVPDRGLFGAADCVEPGIVVWGVSSTQ